MKTTTTIYDDIAEERARQDRKWGVQRHSWVEWMSVLTEEVGEAAHEANVLNWQEPIDTARLTLLRSELIQVAAVAAAAIEHIDEVRSDEDAG